MHHNDGIIIYLVVQIGGNHKIGTVGQGFCAHGFKGLATHNHDTAIGMFFKMFQVLRDVPRQLIVFANGAVLAHRHDLGDFHIRITHDLSLLL